MIISGKTDEEHLANLNAVLEHLEKFGLRANMDKCEFFKEQVSYCGHIISEEGLKKSPDKVKAIRNAPRPENISQLRSFLGLVNYYRSFLPNLSTVLGPLNEVKFHTYLYGRRFTLVTDHKPLVSILNPNAGIPAITAARLQRYAL